MKKFIFLAAALLSLGARYPQKIDKAYIDALYAKYPVLKSNFSDSCYEWQNPYFTSIADVSKHECVVVHAAYTKEKEQRAESLISSGEASNSVFMGRSNLKNTNTSIQKPEHVEDYIFCTECEKRLGVIEGICSQPLNELIDVLAKSNVKIQRTDRHNKFVVLPKPHKNILIIYFYSIIWRQCIQ